MQTKMNGRPHRIMWPPSSRGNQEGRLTGPMIVACQLNMLSAEGPALHEDGGSRPRSINSYNLNSQLVIKIDRRTILIGAYSRDVTLSICAVGNAHLVNALQGHLVRESESRERDLLK